MNCGDMLDMMTTVGNLITGTTENLMDRIVGSSRIRESDFRGVYDCEDDDKQ